MLLSAPDCCDRVAGDQWQRSRQPTTALSIARASCLPQQYVPVTSETTSTLVSDLLPSVGDARHVSSKVGLLETIVMMPSTSSIGTTALDGSEYGIFGILPPRLPRVPLRRTHTPSDHALHGADGTVLLGTLGRQQPHDFLRVPAQLC